MKSVRLGINVASCDGLPAVIAFGGNKDQLRELHTKLSAVIWSEDLAGKFIYASTTDRMELANVSGKKNAGILVVRPDPYGLKGTIVVTIPLAASQNNVRTKLLEATNKFRRNSKSHDSHVRYGRRTNRLWKTEVPVPQRNRRRFRGGGRAR